MEHSNDTKKKWLNDEHHKIALGVIGLLVVS